MGAYAPENEDAVIVWPSVSVALTPENTSAHVGPVTMGVALGEIAYVSLFFRNM